MIPTRIIDYLERHAIPCMRRQHRRAVTAQELAATVHIPGAHVAKSVLVKAGEQIWIAVLPATEVLDERRVAAALGVPAVRMLREEEFEGLFPDSEPGAEPPFGGLYGLPVIIDSGLTYAKRILFRAGSHEEAIEMRFEDFYKLENEPKVAPIGRPQPQSGAWDDWSEPAPF
ncbi:MAG TPA: YbaK/EbsC family protein [Myxococcales bacterium]|nr:YbaK/EbsC family protein [Myxococcales bacterium]